jgi:hypothetical protein
MVIPMIPWERLSMQDLTHCDNNRTPVKFQRVDIYRFVGDIHGARQLIYASNLHALVKSLHTTSGV